MADEMEAAPEAAATGPEDSLRDFLSSADTWADAPDGDGGDGEGHEALGSSEDHADGDPVGDTPEDDGDPSDDVEGAPPPPESHSRMVRKLAQRERELSEHRAQLRERDRQLQELQARLSQQEPEDIAELVRGRIARQLGTRADDQRVTDALLDLARDITLDQVGDAADADPDLRRIREERRAERQRRDERRQLESRIERMEQERRQAVEAAQREQAVRVVGEMLRANEGQHPFLMAQTDVDPAATVVELAQEAIRTGQVPVTPGDDEAAGRLISQIAKNLDAHYRGLAMALSKKLPARGGSPEGRLDVRTTSATGKAAKRSPTKRPGSAGTGGGGRGTPRPSVERDEAEPESFSDFYRREARREATLRKRR